MITFLLKNFTSDPLSHVSNGCLVLTNGQYDESMPDRMRTAADVVKPVRQFVVRDEAFGDLRHVKDKSKEIRSY